MARKIYLNDALDELWRLPTRSPILRHDFVRGSTPQIELRYLDADNAVIDPGWAGSAVTLSFKSTPTAADLLISAVTATKSGTAATTVYTFAPVFSANALDTLLGDGLSAEAYGEIASNSTYDYCVPFLCRISQNVNRGGEASPGIITSSSGVVLNTITALGGGGDTDLDSVATTALTAGTGIPYFIRISGQLQAVYLETGAADGSDPGQVAPLDYDGSTNNKHWVRGL